MPGNQGGYKMTTKRSGARVLPACLCLLFGTTAIAQDKPAEVYVYSTYHYCDFSGQDRADVPEAVARRVYKRDACADCGTPVVTSTLQGRTVYACPRCQPA